MHLEVKKHLFDIRQACVRIQTYTRGKTFEDYARDDMLRSAVERQFEIVGEAMRRLGQTDEITMGLIPDARRIIGTSLPVLLAYVNALLDD
ncbi:MAG: DUF86 domain-containing protein [Chloroflexi bacterium]|nr:DUF86 domain-containing protein [Chloroflexota bacterium]